LKEETQIFSGAADDEGKKWQRQNVEGRKMRRRRQKKDQKHPHKQPFCGGGELVLGIGDASCLLCVCENRIRGEIKRTNWEEEGDQMDGQVGKQKKERRNAKKPMENQKNDGEKMQQE
jgi:hypothetical protein